MISRRSLLLGLGGAGAALATTAVALHRGGRAARLPDPFGPLAVLTPRFPAGFGVRRVFVDPGHGAAGNPGNLSCFCREEQDFTLAAGRALAAALRATGAFDVRLAREGPGPVEYRARVEDAEAWGADVFLSLHSDVRGQTGERWNPEPGRECVVNLAAPGFSVLWSDEGEPKLAEARHALARAVARRMREAGFWAYGGIEYGDLYAVDPAQAGVFVDRHAPERRIFVLRRPKVPSVLVETHHALDPREARLWDEPATLASFASAVGAALVDVLGF
ncbi:N-acetylmuramoyl-L-alanine amidase [Polyangium sp. y55x31]|uniref:N-acetylmuramoyl-L-alanine amidase n=1 Tax=Polyangium sp. y55x31 TaxID=3042688 RepID=UPI0024832D00|nr:N-acetylmuramoyl-L-alanine amidase [Polyangium sp. y55x31]MDI1483314.1 N-acetylmuramoyl-L-alanine amidase [Polyangium sp. y55x31]